jgi:hypothetical protein
MLKVLPPNGPTYNYNFGAIPVGIGSGNFTSTVATPNCFDTVAAATSASGAAGDCSTATAVQLVVTADAPLLFWSLLPGGELRKTSIGVSAVAGISAPLCTACNLVPMAVQALDTTDTTDFGFVKDNLYTLSYSCTGTPAPINYPFTTAIGPAGTTTVPYVILNRFDANSSTMPDETDQLYVSGAQGVPSSTNPTVNTLTANPNTPLACFNVMDTDQLLTDAPPQACSSAVTPQVSAMLCGLNSRIGDPSIWSTCLTAVTDFAGFAVNTDNTPAVAGSVPPYASYTGNGRSIITVPIVDLVAPNTTTPMTIQGFRQFLVVQNSDATTFNPGEPNGRIPVLYIGNPAPVQQGWFDTRYAGGSCPVGGFSGPGKVVLHQ